MKFIGNFWNFSEIYKIFLDFFWNFTKNFFLAPNSYTLIGSSGCGKTTLLTCLLGMKPIQSGEIRLFNHKISETLPTSLSNIVGYMPQQISLVAELTIRETLQYFANLYLMSQKTFDERFKMIVDLLDLPQKSKNLQVKNLSGGQQRRVSLAVAIIHNPKLVILDEPTVGLDFLLREKIWDFLIEMTRDHKLTVIITTHYISEAVRSHRCGFMRKGVLIAENSPQHILNELNVESLDEAFQLLCTTNFVGDGGRTREIVASCDENLGCESDEKVTENDWKLFRFQAMKGLLVKECTRLKRKPA